MTVIRMLSTLCSPREKNSVPGLVRPSSPTRAPRVRLSNDGVSLASATTYPSTLVQRIRSGDMNSSMPNMELKIRIMVLSVTTSHRLWGIDRGIFTRIREWTLTLGDDRTPSYTDYFGPTVKPVPRTDDFQICWSRCTPLPWSHTDDTAKERPRTSIHGFHYRTNNVIGARQALLKSRPELVVLLGGRTPRLSPPSRSTRCRYVWRIRS